MADKSLKIGGKFVKICESSHMPNEVNQFYMSGPFRAEAQKRLLLRKGEPVLLTPKAFDQGGERLKRLPVPVVRINVL